MTLWSRVRSWLGATLGRSRMENEMDVELKFHIEAYADDLVRSGVPRGEAMRLARLEFGGIERFKEECRDARVDRRPCKRRLEVRMVGRPLRDCFEPW